MRLIQPSQDMDQSPMAKDRPLPRLKNIFAPARPTPADYAACANKTKYETRLTAKCKGCRVYRCPACGKYHRATDKTYLEEKGAIRT